VADAKGASGVHPSLSPTALNSAPPVVGAVRAKGKECPPGKMLKGLSSNLLFSLFSSLLFFRHHHLLSSTTLIGSFHSTHTLSLSLSLSHSHSRSTMSSHSLTNEEVMHLEHEYSAHK